MAYNLKLNIYNFSLYRITDTIQRRQRDRMVIQYRHEDETTLFENFARSIDPNVNRDCYLAVIFRELLNYFDNCFLLNTDGTKAVSITQDPQPRPFGTSYKIDGMFKGGETGIDRTVYEQGNATTSIKVIARTDVPAVYFYYKLWIPYDAEDGILMIQSYTNMGCTATFRDQMEGFFISLGYKPSWNTMIPTGIMEDYLNRSFINSIRITYNVQQRNNYQGAFASMRMAKKEGWLRNLSISFRELLQLDNYQEQLETQVMTCIDYNPEFDNARVFYTDEYGRKANASIREIEEILPSIILPDSLKSVGSEEPNLVLISDFTDGILERIKRQIGYTPSEMA